MYGRPALTGLERVNYTPDSGAARCECAFSYYLFRFQIYIPIVLYYTLLLFIIWIDCGSGVVGGGGGGGGGRTNGSRKSNLNSDRKRWLGSGGAWLIRTGRLKFKRPRVHAGHKTMPKTNSIRNRARDGYSSVGGGVKGWGVRVLVVIISPLLSELWIYIYIYLYKRNTRLKRDAEFLSLSASSYILLSTLSEPYLLHLSLFGSIFLSVCVPEIVQDI